MSSDSEDVRPISAPNTGPDPRTAHQMPEPDTSRDIRDLDPAPNPDPGFQGGLRPMAPATDGSPDLRIQQPTAPLTGPDPRTTHRMPVPDTGRDPRDLDPAPGVTVPPAGSGGIQAMSAGGGSGGGAQTNGMAGVENPVALNQAGQNAQEIAGILRSKGPVGDDDAMLAAGAKLGADFWSGDLGIAILDAIKLWDQQTGDLVKTCRSIGEKCTQTSGSYTRAESANEAEMNSVRGSLSDFD